MTDVVAGQDIHHQLITLLTDNAATFRVLTHNPMGKCEAVAELRGTALGQGAKALVCKIKGNGVKQHALAILGGDLHADLSKIAAHFGGLKASLASPAEVSMLTGCVFGAIPPFSFHPDLALIADPQLFESYQEIAFNAGQLGKSIILNTKDYLRIAHPELVNFAARSAAGI